MASDKADSAHAEHAEHHENALLGVVALASLFSNCVEAFNLIRASQRWEKEEQLLLARLGIQQARLLIWGDILGISSPPRTVTNSAVPKHPSAAYPDLKEPTFFNARDPRLEDTSTRIEIESALNAIVDRSAHLTREQMMEQFGLKPPKRTGSEYHPALDPTRLDAFREKYELLQEVAESYAHINTRRSNSIAMQTWIISDAAKFASFIALTQQKIDFLVARLDVAPQVDRAMRMDIRAFGWHLTADRTRVAHDVSKLRLVAEACETDYPQYIAATQQALDNISREDREAKIPQWKPPVSSAALRPPKSSHTPAASPEKPTTNGSSAPSANGAANNAAKNDAQQPHPKRPSIFTSLFRFKSTRKSASNLHSKQASLSTPTTPTEAPRSYSETPPSITPAFGDVQPPSPPAEGAPMTRARSKSVGAAVDNFGPGLDGEVKRIEEGGEVKRVVSGDEEGWGKVDSPLAGQRLKPVESNISRHDQFSRVVEGV